MAERSKWIFLTLWLPFTFCAYLHVADHCLWNCRWPKSFSSLSSKIKLTNLFKTIPNSFLVSFEGKAAHS